MKDIHEFVSKYNGKYIDYDKSYGAQCTDIVKQWEKENGWTPLTHGNAIDYWNHGETSYTKVANTPSGVPPVGSLVVFEVGQYGHIVIAMPGSNTTHLVAFSQNDPLGAPCEVKTYNYLRPKVLGWLIHR